MLRDTASYLGTFSHDTVPTFSADRRQSAIINYNKSDQLGSHWVAIYNDPTKKYIEFLRVGINKYRKLKGKKLCGKSNVLKDLM